MFGWHEAAITFSIEQKARWEALLAAAGIALLATRKHRRAALLLGGVTLFHLFGNACWLLCLFPVLMIIALRDMVRLRREAIQKKNSETAQITQETARPAAPSR